MRDLVVTLNENHWVVVVDEIVPIRDFDEDVIKEPTPLKWLFAKVNVLIKICNSMISIF